MFVTHQTIGATQPTATICILLYGDFLQYAQRCLSSILALPSFKDIELRIGMNDAGQPTSNYVRDLVRSHTNILYLASDTNIGKYPLMRKMFHELPINSPYIMWFDDDSYIKTPTQDWLNNISHLMTRASVCGQIMYCYYENNQHYWITQQPWYKGKPIEQRNNGYLMNGFPVGGWWCARTQLLKDLDWPPKNLYHRGGDMLFGEALRQANIAPVNYHEGVAINASLETSMDTSAKRRGLNPPVTGRDYNPPLTLVMHDATKNINSNVLEGL